ncbi:MAG: hypothetical protein OQL16_02675 [Gammaproteobacteria bacterium]|nr:hypothetical protein [Gammaproteobacteria bacterium]
MRNFYYITRDLIRPACGKHIQAGVLLACSVFLPATSHALGIKEPVLKSFINEPLKIEIPLILTRTEKYKDIVIHQIAGENRNISEWVPDLEFSLIKDFDDNYTVVAETEKPVTEPIVHFTISIDTGLHWMQREMSFLLDPKPVQRLAKERAKWVKPKVVLKPSQARLRGSGEETRTEETGTDESQTTGKSIPTLEDGNIYTVQPGDSLSLIAQYFRHNSGATLEQAMVAIFRANPNAFIKQDVNKIKSHFRITIPEEALMKQLSSAEARTIFSQLLAGVSIPAPQQPPTPIASTQAAAPIEPVEVEVEIPEFEIPVVVQPQVKPIEQPVEPEAELLPPEEPAEVLMTTPEEEYRLTLSPEEAEIPELTIEENAGTVVFEGEETAVSRAAGPSPEVKKAMRSAVTDMEDQIVTLRQEVKKLRQSLQGKDNLLALKSESRIRSLAPEKAPSKPAEVSTPVSSEVSAPASSTVPAEQQSGVAILETPRPKQTGGDFDFLRLFLEILTAGAAVAFIGYLVMIKRKRQDGGEFEFPTTFKDFKSLFTLKQDDDDDLEHEEYEFEEEEDRKHRPITRPINIDPPGLEEVRSFMRSTGKTQDGIEVTEEAYDESIDFTHQEEEAAAAAAAAKIEADMAQAQPGEEINPEYLLQEANLSIAFSDLDNAYHLLIKLINHDPKNPAYRLLILGVLKNLLKEEEFIYHANHLAKITDKSFNTQWKMAHKLGRQFMPDHPLFSTPAPTSTSASGPAPAPISQPMETQAPPPAEAPMNQGNLSFAAQKTVVLDTREALAEYEKRMKEKGQLAGSSQTSDTEGEKILDLDDLPDDDTVEEEQQEDKPFRLDMSAPATAEYEADIDSEELQPEPLPTADELPIENITATAATPEEGSPATVDDAGHILEFDESQAFGKPTQAPAEQDQSALSTGNIIEFDTPADETASEEPTEDKTDAPEEEEDLSAETLASMAEFAAIEGISLDTDLLDMHEKLVKEGKESRRKQDEDDDIEDTVFIKRD